MIGCRESFDTEIAVRVKLDALAQASVRVCRNERCYSTTLSAEPRDGRTSSFPDADERHGTHSPLVTVTVWTVGPNQGKLEVTWTPWSQMDLTNGDIFRIEVQAQDGTVLADVRRRVVSYADSYPNGQGCDLEPCRRATLIVDSGAKESVLNDAGL